LRQQRATQNKLRNRTRFRILVAVGSIIALFVLVILVDAALYYNKVHTGVSISGHNVGGLTRDGAAARVTGLIEGVKDRNRPTWGRTST
jgi:hypothetical protein